MHSNKKPTKANGIVQPPKRAHQFTPAVAQLKTPVAPPVYRPQPVPKVLQKKSALVAPEPYRPNAKPIVQAKAIASLRKPPTPPPPYRPEQKRAPVRTNGVARSQAPVLQRRLAAFASRSVVQRAEERKIVFTKDDLDEEGSVPEAMEWEDLSGIARSLNRAATGELDGRHVQAVTLDEDGHMKVFTQKWRSQMGEVPIHDVFGMEDKDYVKRAKKDDHLHAEMLMISAYLKGEAELPRFIGVSKDVCARCSVVLNYFDIPHLTDGQPTDSWLSPWYHAKKAPPKALKGKIPKTVRRGRETPYKDSDWK